MGEDDSHRHSAGGRCRAEEAEPLRSDVEQCMAKILSAGGKSLRAVPGKTFAEFFAGIGLMRCALERHGWTAVYSNDIDPKKLVIIRAGDFKK